MGNASNRVDSIDMASGILIIWMVIGHVGVWLFNAPQAYWFLNRFLFFFMPWFFYKSGLFFTIKEKPGFYGLKKLIKPFVIWSAIGYAVYAAIQIFLYGKWGMSTLVVKPLKVFIYQNLILCNEPIWFLLTLCVTINLASVLLRRVHPLVLAVICLLVAFSLHLIHNEKIPDILANTFSGLCFFSLGFWIKDREKTKVVFWVALAGYLCALLLGSPFVDIRLNECKTDVTSFDYLIWFPASLCGIIVFNALCRWITSVRKCRSLTYIGRNAMTILVSHYLPLYIAGNLLFFFFHSGNDDHLWWWALLIDLILVPITYLIIKILQNRKLSLANR